MNEIYILFLIFGTLYVLENKSINLLAYYVAMVIIIAILTSIYPEINNINKIGGDIKYISYILVLVQISALTILFGFIIMLYPKNNTEILIKRKNILINTAERKEKKKYNIVMYILILSIILYLILILKYNKEINIQNIINNIKEIYDNINYNIIYENNEISIRYTTVIEKLSYILYSEPSNIIKFMIITIILLFAIICLFFILLPTTS